MVHKPSVQEQCKTTTNNAIKQQTKVNNVSRSNAMINFITNSYMIIICKLCIIVFIAIVLKTISHYLEISKIKLENKALPSYIIRVNHNPAFYDNVSAAIDTHEISMKQKAQIIQKEIDKYEEIMNNNLQKLYICESNVKKILSAIFVIQQIENRLAYDLSSAAQQAMVRYVSSIPLDIIQKAIKDAGYLEKLTHKIDGMTAITNELGQAKNQVNLLQQEIENVCKKK